MIYIPAGPFPMGTGEEEIDRLVRSTRWASDWHQKGRFAREQPRHTVDLPAYHIGRCPVTVGEFRAFVAAGGYRQPCWWAGAGWAWRAAAGVESPRSWDDERWTGDDRLPVVGVSWYEADAYCRWLAGETGRHFRLPTEAEWEKAARGVDGRQYPWGVDFDASRCNTRAGGLGRTTPVGSYSPVGDSPYGCTDMVGNVSEWTASLYRRYPYVSADPHSGDGRDDPQAGAERVIRGASWYSPLPRARAAARGLNDPFFRDEDVGFRCAWSP